MNIYIHIFLMAFVTWLIRLIPLLVLRKPVTNRFLKSFLYYAPYITLAVMTFPSVLDSTGNRLTALLGALFALIWSLFSDSFAVAAFGSCIVVYVAQLIL